MLNQQVASFNQAQKLVFISDLALAKATEEIENKAITAWPIKSADVNAASNWHAITSDQINGSQISSAFYVQYIGLFEKIKPSPKIYAIDQAVKQPQSYLYRITTRVEIGLSYSRLMEIDYVRVDDE